MTLLERTSSGERFRLRDFPRRPQRWALRPSTAARPSFGCVGPGPVRVWWRAFRTNDRAFNLLVSIGTTAPARIQREARAVVNSLQVTPGRTVGGGPWLRLPPGWSSLSYASSGAQVLRASTAALPSTDIRDDDGAASQAALSRDDVLVNVVRFFGPRSGARAFPRARLPLRFARSDFPPNRYEGQAAAALSVRWVVVHGQLLRVLLALGPGDRPGAGVPAEQRLPPDADALIARANAVLDTLVLAEQ